MRYLSLLLLIPALAFGQGLSQNAPGVTGGGKVLASFPLTTSGGLITEDANTVAHVYWNGTALVDTKGNAWTQNGTVPQVTANPFTTTRYGAGPFSAANYYSLGTGADVLDFAADFTVCVVASTVVNAALQMLTSDFTGGAAGEGWYLAVSADGTAPIQTNTSASAYTSSITTNTFVSGPNIVCGGRSGSNQYVKLNLATTITTAGAKTTAGTASVATVGMAATLPVTGTIYEVWASSTPFTEAQVVGIMQKVLGHYDGSAPLAVTRSTNASYIPRAADCATGPCLYTAAPGVARFTESGLLVEPARTNRVANTTIATGTTYTSGVWNANSSNVATVAGGPTGLWAEVTSTASGGGPYVGGGGAFTSTATFSGSAWMAKASGTGYAGVAVGCGGGTPSTCTCTRSDGGSCATATHATNYCAADVSDLGTTPIRLTATVVCSGALTGPPAVALLLFPGQRGVATGTTRFAAPQYEDAAAYGSSFIATAGTAVARNADQISATVPAVPSKWCVAVTAKPEEGRAWAWTGMATLIPWSLGTFSGANSAYSSVDAGGVYGLVTYNATPTIKYTSGTASLAAGSSHRLSHCSTDGALSVAIDSVVPALTPGGAGTGLFATTTTMYLGSASTGANSFGGYLKSLKICAAKSAKECK